MEQNNFNELINKLNSIESKLDKLLENQTNNQIIPSEGLYFPFTGEMGEQKIIHKT